MALPEAEGHRTAYQRKTKVDDLPWGGQSCPLRAFSRLDRGYDTTARAVHCRASASARLRSAFPQRRCSRRRLRFGPDRRNIVTYLRLQGIVPPAAKTKVGDLPFGLLLADGRGSDLITRVRKDLQSHDREGVDADDLFQHPASVGRAILPAAGFQPA